MSRINLDPAQVTALAASNVKNFWLVELGLDSGRIYLADVAFDVDWDGNTYTAALGLGRIDPVTETDKGAMGLVVTMSAVNQAAIAMALTEDVQGREFLLRLAIVDGTTLRIDPCVWKGQMDVMSSDDDGKEPVIRVTAEHAAIAWQRPSGAMFSDAEQQKRHPGDKFFEYAAQISEATIVWPAASFFKQ